MVKDLTCKEKFEIMQDLDIDISIRLDANKKWYVNSAFEKSDGKFLRSECGRGDTPEKAVEEHFSIYCEHLPEDRFVKYYDRKFRWSGFSWKEV